MRDVTSCISIKISMQGIPKSGILKVSTQSQSLASTSASSSSPRVRISRARQSKLRRNPQKRDAPNMKSTNNTLQRVSTVDSQSSADITAETTKNVHDETAAQTNDANQRRVRFNTISIREYEIQPSDNPASIYLPGLELGWKYNIVLPSGSIDTFENQRGKQRRLHYQKRPLPTKHRRLLLQRFGFSQAEIEAASNRARTLKEERERSVDRMQLDWYDRIVEDLRVGCSSAKKWSCKSKAVVDGVEGSKRETGSLLHPSVLVDTSVETSSVFDNSGSKGDHQQQMMLDDDDFATKVEVAQ